MRRRSRVPSLLSRVEKLGSEDPGPVTRDSGLRRRRLAVGPLLLSLVVAVGCASSKPKVDKLTRELLSTPKEALFEKGQALIQKKKYDRGRKYLNFVFESYPNDPLGRQALLLVADSYFKERGTTGYVEARYRYRNYLSRYPGAINRDYAYYQYALCFDKEHEKADRDQANTRSAIEQYQALSKEYPDSPYAGLARTRLKALLDLLAEHEFLVGLFYLRKGAPAAAVGRFVFAEERFPGYSARDKLYYYQGLALRKLGRSEEAKRYFERLAGDFPRSPYEKLARRKGFLASAEAAPTGNVSVDTRRQSE